MVARSDFVGRVRNRFFVFCLFVVLSLASFMFHFLYWLYVVSPCVGF